MIRQVPLLLPTPYSLFPTPCSLLRRTVTHAGSNPADDQRPNNPSVPDVYALDAHLRRVFIFLFKYGIDLLASLHKMIPEKKICNSSNGTCLWKSNFRVADIHVSHLSRENARSEGALLRARTGLIRSVCCACMPLG